MKALFTADWQCEFANIDLCKQAWAQVLEICGEQGLETIVVAGDLKRAYNPVDVRVAKFWIYAIRKAIKRRIEVVVLLGNHDRVGMYADAQNWLSILRVAGAITFDEPGFYKNLALLPFCSNTDQLRKNAFWLVQHKLNRTSILVFHADITGSKYNKLGAKSEGKFHARELYPHRYKYCIGGHIHLHQKIEDNIYYTGSPFCCDWGEANQRKGYMVYDDKRSSQFVVSDIPGWYDTKWPGFPKDKTKWKGCRVRIHIQCSAREDYGKAIETARRKAEEKYKGAQIFVCLEFTEEESAACNIAIDDTDDQKISAYVGATLPDSLREDKQRIIRYLTRKLEKSSSQHLRQGHSIIFRRAIGKNFLCFKRVEISFEETKGIVVIEGKNLDRDGCSNGSGKTSLLQLIPVALFGTTFKGQKHDKWARRGVSEESKARLVLSEPEFSGRTNGKAESNVVSKNIAVIRTRHPSKIQLYVNGVDRSSGIRGDSRSGTQGLLEHVTGFTWQTLANAVYIDTTIARTFISGTKSERTALLSKFQNLERFTVALEEVKRDYTAWDAARLMAQNACSEIRARIADCKLFLKRARLRSRKRVLVYKKEYMRCRNEFGKRLAVYKMHHLSSQKEMHRIEAAIAHYDTKIDKVPLFGLEAKQSELTSRITDSSNLRIKVCPTCQQKVNKRLIREFLENAKAKLKVVRFGIHEERQRLDALKKYREKLADRSNIVYLADEKERIKVGRLKERVSFAKQQYSETKQQTGEIEEKEHHLSQLRTKRKVLDKHFDQIVEAKSFYEYCLEAFSRDGIPAFLNAQLCPVLNKAAEYYAGLFADKAMQVRFEINDGEFEPKIINTTGGENIDDQSMGEKALAGLIASFALREIAPKCNILILDEPGLGLDPANARKFAIGLKELKNRFDTILITSHDTNLLQELASERKITVIKSHGISHIQSSV